METREEFYLRKLSVFLGQGMSPIDAEAGALLNTAIYFDGRVDFNPPTNREEQYDQDEYREELK